MYVNLFCHYTKTANLILRIIAVIEEISHTVHMLRGAGEWFKNDGASEFTDIWRGLKSVNLQKGGV